MLSTKQARSASEGTPFGVMPGQVRIPLLALRAGLDTQPAKKWAVPTLRGSMYEHEQKETPWKAVVHRSQLGKVNRPLGPTSAANRVGSKQPGVRVLRLPLAGLDFVAVNEWKVMSPAGAAPVLKTGGASQLGVRVLRLPLER